MISEKSHILWHKNKIIICTLHSYKVTEVPEKESSWRNKNNKYWK